MFYFIQGHKITKNFPTKRKQLWLILISSTAEIIMVGGYFLYEMAVYGYGASIISLPGNVLQGIIAIIICSTFSALNTRRQK